MAVPRVEVDPSVQCDEYVLNALKADIEHP
jgi:hypothetical protein